MGCCLACSCILRQTTQYTSFNLHYMNMAGVYTHTVSCLLQLICPTISVRIAASFDHKTRLYCYEEKK